MSIKKPAKESQFQLLGWVLFLVCSILSILSSLATGSPLGLAGSVLFFLGCVVFIIPLTRKG